MATTAFLSGWQRLVLFVLAILATPPYTAVLTDAQPDVWISGESLAVVLADARAAALLALASFAVVLAEFALPAYFFAAAPYKNLFFFFAF